MPLNLYEILGLGRNATPEEVRKAYRRKALETHPDRLPQGASPAEKSASEELFRKINNAYEVLSDPHSRAAYDAHGVWPPPAPAPQTPYANGPHAGHGPSSDPFHRDPFFRDPFSRDPFSFGSFGFGSRPDPRHFTDPFVLFNSIFGDLHRAFEAGPFFDTPFNRLGFEPSQLGGGFFNRGFSLLSPSPFDLGGRSSRMQVPNNIGTGGRWVSESWVTSTVNGVTHTKCVRKDSEGNEHVSYRFPDGTERRTINGIEQSTSQQPPRALLPSAPPAPPVSYPTRAATLPPPAPTPLPPYYEAVAQPPHHSRPSRHRTHYDSYSGDRHEPRDEHRHGYSGRGYHDDGQGRDIQAGSGWKSWRS